jgi:hypothetical protein
MASAKAFDLTAQLKIAADPGIIQDAEAVNDRNRMTGYFDHFVRAQSQIRPMTDSQHHGIGTCNSAFQIMMDQEIF